MNPKDIGSVILTVRKEKNISQSYLAKQCNCVQSTIARIESGQRLPSINLIDKIGKVLEINLIALLGDYHKPKESFSNTDVVAQMNLFLANANRVLQQLQERNSELEKELQAIKKKLEM